MEDGEVEHRGRYDADVHDVQACFDEAVEQLAVQARGAQTAVAPEADRLVAEAALERTERAPELTCERVGEVTFGDAADVVLAKDIEVHAARGLARPPEKQKWVVYGGVPNVRREGVLASESS